jgi:peptidoglycan/xylan/chitin deacetylase (PgdA/CDA1 family)
LRCVSKLCWKTVAPPERLPKLFRPPHGRLTAQQAEAVSKEYQIVMWSVLSGDFDTQLPAEICLAKTIRYTATGAIVVFHDSEKAFPTLRRVLPDFLSYCRQAGYQFGLLD